MSYKNETHSSHISDESAEDAQAGLVAIAKFIASVREDFALLVQGLPAHSANSKLVAEEFQGIKEAIEEALYAPINELKETCGGYNAQLPNANKEHSTMHVGAGGSL